MCDIKNKTLSAYTFLEIEKLVDANKNNYKPVLICTKNKKVQKELLEHLSEENLDSDINIAINKNDFVCKVRLNDFLATNENDYLTEKLKGYRSLRLSEIKWLSKSEKQKICVIGSQCFRCKESNNCIYTTQRNNLKKKNNKFDLIVASQLCNKILSNINFIDNYSKIIFYCIDIKSLNTTLSNKEMLNVVDSLIPKKLNTKHKVKLNKCCNRCQKLIKLFFINKNEKAKIELLEELEKLGAENNYGLRFIINKLKHFNENNITGISETGNCITIKFRLNI